MPEKKEKPKFSWKEKRSALARQLAPYRSTIVTLSILGILSAAANGVVPYLTGKFFDSLITPHTLNLSLVGSTPLWTVLLLSWAVIQLVANAVSWVIDRKNRRLTTELQAGLQARAFAKLVTLPVSFHKKHRTGEIGDLINKAGWMLESMAGTVINLGPQLLTIAIGVAISFTINALLAEILLVGVAVYFIVLIRILPNVAHYQEEGHTAWNRAYGDAYDAYTNISTVKQANAELYEEKRIMAGFYEKAIPLWYKIEQAWSTLNTSQRAVVTLTQGVILLVAVFLVGQGKITIGDLIAFNAYAGMIIGPFVALGTQWQNIQNGLVAVARAEVIFGADSETYEPKNAVPFTHLTGEVEFEDVHFAYEAGQPEVLKGMSFKAEPGDVVAFVGETGVGKSTTVELISGYYFATTGRVLVDGVDIREANLRGLRSHIAVVPQEVVLFNASIKDNIRYGRPEASDEEVITAAKRAQADAFIGRFPQGYEQEVGERGVKLSVGQKQRIAIARAMLRNPAILILDEPTSALDPETEANITRSLEELMEGRTTFIIAHRLSTVRQADQILVLEAGQIAERGTHAELLTQGGKYSRLYNLHIGLHE